MIFTPEELQRLFNIIDFRFAKIAADVLGDKVLSKQDILLLDKYAPKWKDELKKFPPYYQSYLFGRLSGVLNKKQLDSLSYKDFEGYLTKMQFEKPTKLDMAAYDISLKKTYSYLKGIGDRIKTQLASSVSNQEMQILIEKQRQKDLETIKEELSRGVLEKKSVPQIVSDIGHKLDEWQHDWGRIVETEMQNIYELGAAQRIAQEHGPDARVYKTVYGGACFPVEDTEILTNEGFKLLKDITGKELAATYNLETNTLEYSSIVGKIEYDYEGELHCYRNKSLDIQVTPDHNMLISIDHKKNAETVTFNFLKQSEYVLENKTYYMRYTVANWNGYNDENILCGGKVFKTKHFARFMGWYLSEGHCIRRFKDKKGRFFSHTITISQHKEENFKDIEFCLKQLFKHVTRGKMGCNVSLDKSYDDFIDWLKSCGEKSYLKKIPFEIKNLSKEFLIEFLDAYLKGDNYYEYKGKESLGKKYTAIITSSVAMKDDLYEIILKCGFRPSWRIIDQRGIVRYDRRGVRFETKRLMYIIGILTIRKFSNIEHSFKKIDNWKGHVGCIEVEKNKTIYIRRHGFGLWVGNCKFCIKFYTTNGIGSKPRIFKLADLMANGTNIGRRQKDWLPTVGPVHPFCRCVLNYLPDDYVWSDERQRFEMKPYKRKIERRSKVTITVGDKKFEV